MSISRRQFVAGAGAVVAAAALPAAAPARGGFLAKDVKFFVGEAGLESMVPIDSLGGFLVPRPIGRVLIEQIFIGGHPLSDVDLAKFNSVAGGCTRDTPRSS